MAPLGLGSQQLAAPATGPKRILAIEGGGVRGVFSLQILARMEELLRLHYQRPNMVLAEHFHLIAGTSVGAILGTFLSWGWSVADLSVLFEASLQRIFSRASWWKLPGAAFRRGPLREILQREFAETDGTPALFGTQRLKTWLLIVVRNLSTGSVWPLINHPAAKFNQLVHADGRDNLESNLRIPLWQLVRGSTAAPWFFPPERVEIGPGNEVEFLDGGVTAYNNPSVIAFLMATLPCYSLRWEQGVDQLQMVSVGVGRARSRLSPLQRWRFGRIGIARKMPSSLMDATSQAQDLLMRSIGRCEYGEPMDSEIGSLAGASAVGHALRYCRYDRVYAPEEIEQACAKYRTRFGLSAVKLLPWLQEQGQRYAAEFVRIEHLL